MDQGQILKNIFVLKQELRAVTKTFKCIKMVLKLVMLIESEL